MSNNPFVFVKCNVCYADEFDCEFFGVFPKEVWEKKVEASKNISGEIEIYFGTNEFLEVYSSKDWMRRITVKEISKEEALWLQEAFHHSKDKTPNFTWGTGSNYLDIESYLEDEDDGDE